jgi:hypothetical protein
MAGESGGHNVTTGVWIAVAVIIAGSIIAGVALIEWVMWLFYGGMGLMVAGCVIAYFTRIMDAVTEFGSGSTAELESS